MSGMFRYFNEDTRSAFDKYIVNSLNCDVFVNVWENFLPEKGVHGDATALPVDVESIKSITNLKKFRVEPNVELPISDVNIQQKELANTFYMLYMISRGFDLLEQYEAEHGIKYDVVIRCRSDLLYDKHFNVECLRKCIRPGNILYFPRCQVYDGINDQFFFGNRDTMNIVCNLYEFILDSCRSGALEVHPERAIAGALKCKDVLTCIDPEATHYGLIRNDYVHYGPHYFYSESVKPTSL